MAKSLIHVLTAVWAVLVIAPWAVYLAGVAQITNDLVGYFVSALWVRQGFIMLEWWTIWFEFFIVIMVFIFALMRRLRGSGYWLNAFLAINTALIILRATSRITQATLLDDGATMETLENLFPADFLEAYGSPSDALQRVRLTAAGQVSTAFANMVLSILIGHAASTEFDAFLEHKGAAPPNTA